MKRVRFTTYKTTVVIVVLLGFLIGLGLARRVSAPHIAATVCCIVTALCLRRKYSLLLVFAFGTGLFLGLHRGSVAMQSVRTYQRFARTPVIVRGVATTDAIYAEKSQLSFDIGQIMLLDPQTTSLVGKIGVKGFGVPMVQKGDTVQVEGKLFPTRGSRQASMSYSDISIIRKNTSNIEVLRRKFVAGVLSTLPEPLGSFGLGLLIGQRSTLPKDFTDQLSTVGLTHIVAVSGYNLTIIVLAVHRITRRRSKYQSLAITLGLIGLFLLFTGSSASIVRATVVSVLSLCAWYYGRSIRPIVLLLMGAALTAGWYPIYLWSDLGWWLSFLAFSGILLVAPLFEKRFFRKRPKILAQTMIETIAAQLMTLPLIMYIFGKLSVVALLANVAIVPLVPLAMLLSFVAGLAGVLLTPIAGWIALPARLLMTFMVEVIQLFSRLPHAQVLARLRFDQMLLVYAFTMFILVLWLVKIQQKLHNNRDEQQKRRI